MCVSDSESAARPRCPSKRYQMALHLKMSLLMKSLLLPSRAFIEMRGWRPTPGALHRVDRYLVSLGEMANPCFQIKKGHVQSIQFKADR